MTSAQSAAKKDSRATGADWLTIAVLQVRHLVRAEVYSNLTDPNRLVRIEFDGNGRFAITASGYVNEQRTKSKTKKGAW